MNECICVIGHYLAHVTLPSCAADFMQIVFILTSFHYLCLHLFSGFSSMAIFIEALFVVSSDSRLPFGRQTVRQNGLTPAPFYLALLATQWSLVTLDQPFCPSMDKIN